MRCKIHCDWSSDVCSSDLSLDELVQILGAQEVPPHLILSPEVNVPKKLKKVDL
jgi:hypothetical protein